MSLYPRPSLVASFQVDRCYSGFDYTIYNITISNSSSNSCNGNSRSSNSNNMIVVVVVVVVPYEKKKKRYIEKHGVGIIYLYE